MNKKITSLALGIMMLCSFLLNAQERRDVQDWPSPGSFVVDTLLSKTSCLPLVICAGGEFEMSEFIGEMVMDYGFYGYARYRLGKIGSVSGFVHQSMLSLENGGGAAGTQEVRASFFFKSEVNYASGSKKFGKEGVMEYSAPYSYPQATFLGFSAAFLNKKSFESIVSDSTGKYGQIVNKSTGAVLKDSFAIIKVNAQILAAGFYFSNSSKFKGRVRATMPSGRHVKRMVRKSASFDGGIEMLMALNIKESTQPLYINSVYDPAYVNNFEVKDYSIKRFGWRVWIAGKLNPILSITTQFGSKPGINDNLSEYEGPKFFKPLVSNMYLTTGLGIAIGLL